MAESFSDVIRRTPDAEKRKVCCWCAAKGEWEYPVTEMVTGEALTVYCCTVECQQALKEAWE